MDPSAKRQLGSSPLQVEQLSSGAGPLGDQWALHDDRSCGIEDGRGSGAEL